MLIHLNGMPGVGKLTVAKILAERLPAHLVDNHSILNVIYAAGHEHGSPAYAEMFFTLTHMVYSALAQNREIVPDLVMTAAYATELPEDIQRMNDTIALADARKEPFVPVFLFCELEENVRRLTEPTRAEKKKLTRPDIFRSIASTYTIIDLVDHPNRLAIDTTSLRPEETADMILDHVRKLGLI